MRVLLAVVTRDQCSLGFAISMLRLQSALRGAPGIHATVELVSSVSDAVQLAADIKDIDAVVAVESQLSFPAGFVLNALVAPSPFVVGVYPLPRLDWERVAAKARAPGEDMRYKGNVYNIDPATAKHQSQRYLGVSTAALGAVVLKAEALCALAKAEVTTDEGLCAAWGKTILADLENQCSNSGPMEFTGCVGLRAMA